MQRGTSVDRAFWQRVKLASAMGIRLGLNDFGHGWEYYIEEGNQWAFFNKRLDFLIYLSRKLHAITNKKNN